MLALALSSVALAEENSHSHSVFVVRRVLDLDIKHQATASKDRTGLFTNPLPFLITESTGGRIKTWCMGEDLIKHIEDQVANARTTQELSNILTKYPSLRNKVEPLCFKRKQELEGVIALSIGGIRAYNHENLYGKKTEEHFKVFIGFKNHVCINLCISTDGFLDDLRVMSMQELFNRVFQLLTRFDADRQLNYLKTLSEYSLTEHQFAQLIGRSRLYNYLPKKQKAGIDKLPLSDTQISTVARDYYQDHSFCKSKDGSIDMWRVYNLFTSSAKSSYIDSFLDRNTGSLLFISGIISHLRNSAKSWYLS